MGPTPTPTRITEQTVVADLVVARPGTARVFEQHHVDYCCGGQRSLADACDVAGAVLAEVLSDLAEIDAEPAGPPAADDIGALIGHIVATHHTYLRRELPRLDGLMAKVVAAHGAAHPEITDVSRLLAELADDLIPHLAKEEQILFPLAIQVLGAVEPTAFHCGTVRNPIQVMHTEHDRVGELLSELRSRTDDYRAPEDACPTFRALYAGLAELEADIHRHVHLENNVLFPAIVTAEQALAVE